MQHHAPFGYPTPPPSPSAYDQSKCDALAQQQQQQQQQQQPTQQQPLAARSFQSRCVPLAPEERLGRLLEGKLQLTDILGTGAYGVVYAAVDIKSGVRYAVKCLCKFNPDGTPLERRQMAYQQREIRLHYLASAHRNVVSMLKIVDDPDCIYVILEYCPEGDLFLNITERGQYVGHDELAKKVFLQILDAVEHCHSLGIYHRDLKPENILVTDNGETVKLADFGLATSDDRSEDYGCGSTFYMSPECLDPSTRKPYYMCAPNDVWSLGVILVNLTCGRNPWKQASFQDSTYRAYARSQDFLKTILPLTDELNDILGRIFHPNSEQRVSLSELRRRIMACSRFTVPAMPAAMGMPSPSATPDHCPGNAVSRDEMDEYDSGLSPSSSSDDEGSLVSSGSTIDDLDEEDEYVRQQHRDLPQDYVPQIFELEEPRKHQQLPPPSYHGQEFVPRHYTGTVPAAPIAPVPVPAAAVLASMGPIRPLMAMPVPVPVPVPVQAPIPMPTHCQPRSFFPLWEMVQYVKQVPIMQHPVPFHPQVSFLPSFQGCY